MSASPSPSRDPWALAFHGLFELRAGRPGQAVACLDELAGGPGFDEAALGLWLASEAAVAPGPGRPWLEGRRQTLDAIVERLTDECRVPAANWMDLGVPGVYATRLALAYGALASYGNAGSRRAGTLAPGIRDAFFRDFLAGGKLRSRRGGDSLFTDIVLCAVPFGVIDAGNQILVESVTQIEARQYRGGFAFADDTAWLGGTPRADLDTLMAWYYSERGDLARAQRLLAPWAGKPAAGTREDALFRLAQQNIDAHSGEAGTGVQVLHEPAGHGSRYHPHDRNRSPLHPVGGQSVVVRAVVRYAGPGTRLALEAEGAQAGAMVHVGLDGAQGHWEGALTQLAATAQVRYRFLASTPDGDAATEWFTFRAGSRHDVAAVTALADGTVSLKTASGAEVKTVIRAAPDCELLWRAGGFALVRDGEVLVRGWNRLGLAPLSVDLDADGRLQALRLRLKVGADEEFYGTGERFSALGLRGKRVDTWVFNQYRDQGLRSYIPLPFWHSSGGWGLRVLGGGYSETGFCDRIEGLVEVELEAGDEGITFYSGRPWEIVRAYLNDTGLPALPPRWVFGPWMSSNNWDRQALTLEQARLTRELKLPATVLVLEQWSDEATFYVFNDAEYELKPGDQAHTLKDFTFPAGGRWPDPKAMVDELHAQGLKVILWQAPVMKALDGQSHAQRDEDERVMVEKGWALKHRDGRPYRIPDFEWFKRSLVPDFTHPQGAAWWLSKRRYLFDEVGIDGIKTDGGEGVYGEVTDSAGHAGDRLRNRYPVDYVGAFHRFVQDRTGGQGVTFSRAGFEGSQTIPAHWSGDERSTFEAFRNSLRAGLTAGLSGLPFWGWDLGGFNGDVPDAELYLRGAAMAAFCPLMQYHAESKGERNRDRTPWNIAERTGDPRVVPLYRQFAQARMNLLPYLWAEAQHCAATGEAMMRALAADYPGPDFRRVDDQYLLGRSLLVAPVVHPGAVTRTVALPPGTWVPLFGGGSVEGPRVIEVPAPLSEIPVWYKAGAAIALNLPATGEFPGDVGSQWDAYTRLTFLAAPGVRVDEVYNTYDGRSVVLKGTPGIDLVPVAPFPVWLR
jgi:alpha-glucosidase (family GH31 glycosyl hydrolase)